MTYRAIYAYAWDIAERGARRSSPRCTGSASTRSPSPGATTPANSSGRGERGQGLFPGGRHRLFPRRIRRATARSSRVANSLLAERDVLARALCGDSGIAVNAWMVLLHNTRLGEAYPDATVANAFGDRYVYSLCPSNPEAREYAVALCKDVTDHYPVIGISVEAPGFAPYRPRLSPRVRAGQAEPLARSAARPLLLRPLHALAPSKAGIDANATAGAGRAPTSSPISPADIDLPDDMAEAFWLARHAERRRARGLPRLALQRRDVAGRRDPGGGAQGCGGRGDPLGGAADRRRLVRGQRPRRARRGCRHRRGVLLRAESRRACTPTPGM